jgi:hypothetical protein
VTGENINNLQYKINNVMNELQTWFRLNNLVVNAEKTLALSFHVTQNKNPPLPGIIFEGTDISYNTESKFLGVYINKNMKWNSHIKYLSSKLNTSYYIINSLKTVTSTLILRTVYFAHFHVHLRYGLTLWGDNLASLRIFKSQKKAIRIVGKVSRHASCRNLFRELGILPLPCMYIREVVCYVKSNLEKMIGNEDMHAHFTCQKSDFHVQYCRTTLFKNSSVNMGIKLYNKLPNEIKKLEKLQDLKKTQALLTTTDILCSG